MSAQPRSRSSGEPTETSLSYTPLAGGQSAEQLCKKVLDSDSSIVHSSLVDSNGSVVARGFRRGGPTFKPPEGIENRYGHWVRIMQGMSKEVDHVFGKTELITIVHRGFTLNAIPLGEEVGALTFVADRSANLEYLLTRIRHLTGA